MDLEDKHNKEIYKEWKRRRRIMTYIGYFQAFLFGLEYTSLGVSGLYYFSDDIRPSNPKLFYGMSMGAMYSSAVFANPILGRIMDKTRKLRSIIFATLSFGFVGNFVYLITYSAWFPVVGRFICGLADGAFAVMTGISIILNIFHIVKFIVAWICLLYTSPSPRDS